MLNMDGINLRHGCKNFRIENISGYIEEDCIAISSLDSGNKAAHVHGGLDSTMLSQALWQGPEDDSEQIFISNVQTGITGVAIWASGQAGVHNVYINGVTSGNRSDGAPRGPVQGSGSSRMFQRMLSSTAFTARTGGCPMP